MQAHHTKRKFTPEEKQQLLDNLDLEVAHRTRQFEGWLADTLADFRIRHEGQILRIPHIVRGVTIAEFGDKYNGDIQACVRGIQKERMALESVPIDRTAMKRKWVAQENDVDGEAKPGSNQEGNPVRAAKTPRIAVATPKKKASFSTSTAASRARLPNVKTPGTARLMQRVPSGPVPSASPNKKPFLPVARTPSRPTSPSKPSRVTRPPSRSTFDPAIPKTPAYPPRWPRKDESMLSVNGSPLANPYELGLDWLAGSNTPPGDEKDGSEDDRSQAKNKRPLSRTNSSIVIRRDPSFASSASSSGSQHGGLHSRSNSQSNLAPSAQGGHSRSNSQTSRPPSQLGSASSGHIAARVAVQTKDGHTLEFDPLLTSPTALDKLEGITESAKKQAKEDMVKLMQAAVAKWNIAT
ncbi:hypothetical protein DENSPDRAFT_928420 [Dentipellis sp. KUC8613]|nr:hypothetical protein DENSPDRAFT_928420 [Dentipellis sp. KUC8613]